MADVNKETTTANTNVIRPRNNFLARPKLFQGSNSSNPFKLGSTSYNNSDVSNLFTPKPSSNPEDLDISKNNNQIEEKSGDDIVPKFVPLQSSKDSVNFASGTSKSTPISVSHTANFVFGQNLRERIINSTEEDKDNSIDVDTEHSSSNGTSNSLFSAAIQTSNEKPPVSNDESKSLAQSAQTWERLRESSLPVLPPQQQVLTGEEDEKNVLQINCRIFAFEESTWKERGHGQLRLNDGKESSRLVCRSAGSLRILFNTKIFGDMTVEILGKRSLQLTATDLHQQLKIFLIMATYDEISQLYNMVYQRVLRVRTKEENSHQVAGVLESVTETKDTKLKAENSFDTTKKCDSALKDSIIAESEDRHKTSDGNPIVVISSENEEVSISRAATKRPHSSDRRRTTKKSFLDFPWEDDDDDD